MNIKTIKKIFSDTAFVRMGGSDSEKRAAEYIKGVCENIGVPARLESFPVDMAEIRSASLTVDGKDIPCKGYLLAGSSEIEAELYYLTESDRYSLSFCKGKIVMVDGYLGMKKYKELCDGGAVGFITYNGSVNYSDRDIDQRELRSYVAKGNIMPGVNINVKDATRIIKSGAKTAKITLDQIEYKGSSQNVIADIKGEREEMIALTAHYDSTSLSKGAYDNMSGSIGILALLEYFAKNKPLYSLRFIWCGSEERGLLGSKAYCAENESDVEKTVLCVNLDMIGSVMGKFAACCTSEEKLVSYISYMGDELGMQVKAYQDVYSSDSTPFADKGVPAVSFARWSPSEAATIHNSYDTVDVIRMEHMVKDIEFIRAFTARMANARLCPVAREMPDNMRKKLDEYLGKDKE